VETFSVYAPKLLPAQERFISGRRSCKGCGKALTVRIASKGLDQPQAFVGAPPAMPGAELTDAYGFAHSTSLNDDLIEESLRRFDGITAGQKPPAGGCQQARPKPVLAISRRVLESDGTALTRALKTHPDLLVLCLDNEPSLDAFIKRAIPQPFQLKERWHAAGERDVAIAMRSKNMPPLARTDAFAYRATVCPSHPFDLIRKVNKGLAVSGGAFILALTPCPTGWMFPPRQVLSVGSCAVRSGWFPLYEVINGTVTLTCTSRTRMPVAQFMAMQNRFFTVPKALIPCFQREIDAMNANLEQTDTIDGNPA
jgi:pyruvate ferredoxin oxidoreductase beta subunit